MKKRNLVLIALVFALIICATIQPAIAYFTTYVRAKGGHEVTLGDTTTIQEKIIGKEKIVSIHNDSKSEPVYIRAKVLYTGSAKLDIKGDGWSGPTEGYYYYDSILNGGEDTKELKVSIGALVTSEEEIKKLKDGESFSVVVVYESTPVRYDANGNPYADWNAQIVEVGSTSSTTGGNG